MEHKYNFTKDKQHLNTSDLLGSLLEISSHIRKWQFDSEGQPTNQKEEFTWEPKKCIEYEVSKFTLPDTRKQGYQKEQLSKVLAFIDANKQRRYKDCCTIMPIPQTNRKYLSIWGSPMNISNGIKFMKQIGLISDENQDYRFNQHNTSTNFSKTYRYYYENECKILEYCELHQINKYKVSNVSNNQCNNTLVKRFKFDTFDEKQVRFSSQLHLLKPDGMSCAEFEKQLKIILNENYPDLLKYSQLADDINEQYYEDYPDLQLAFNIKITWNRGNKSVCKISIRLTNSLCPISKEQRPLILHEYGFNLHKDVKSSVPRLTASLNNGYWIDESVDMYELIYNKVSNVCINNQSNNTLVKRFKFDTFDEDIRDSFKKLHLSTYFDSYNEIGKNNNFQVHGDFYFEELKGIMQIFKYIIEDTEGKLFDSEIFYHESCIYMEVLNWLLNNNFFTWILYDSWYSRDDNDTKLSQEEFEDLVTNLVEDTANRYIENWEDRK